MSNLLKKYSLEKWYKSSFNNIEIGIIENKYTEINDNNACFNGSASYFLASIIQWINTKENYTICRKFADKSIELLCHENNSVIDLFYIYSLLIQFFYKNRDKDDCLEMSIEYCNKQIDLHAEKLLPPVNPIGYIQLSIIEKKNKNWNRVIELCTQAKNEEWIGDWDKRILEAKLKMNK